MPATPTELVATVSCPLRRVVMITHMAASRNGNLPRGKGWAEQRINDLRTLLTATPPTPQCEIAKEAALSRQRVSELARLALGESPA